MTLTILTLTLLADVAPMPPMKRPPPPPAQCTAHDQCVLSTFQGCCGGCCPSEPHAIPRGTKEGQICAAVDCAMPDCAAVKCASARPVTDFEAVCRAGQCVAVPKPPPAAAQCRTDGDCQVSFNPAPGASCASSPCGCCPYPRAVPLDERRRPSPSGPSPKQPVVPGPPTFGLSSGDGRADGPTPPQCSPCPSPPPMRAVCRANQCVLQPIGPPRPLPPG